MTPGPATQRVSTEDIRRVARAALARAGCDSANAAAVAEVMARSDADGCASHGIFRLAGYVAALNSGKVNGRARPSARPLAPGVVQIDGHRGFAPLAIAAAREALEPMARGQGIAAAAVLNVHHFSALWVDIEPLVEKGLAALCFTAYMPAVAPHGARKPFFGTNPMAFGWPRTGGRTMIFDQASAAMARGEIMIAARDGHSLPPESALTPAGIRQPTLPRSSGVLNFRFAATRARRLRSWSSCSPQALSGSRSASKQAKKTTGTAALRAAACSWSR
jgi:delta1-piperideine-2-carboxylate reductase